MNFLMIAGVVVAALAVAPPAAYPRDSKTDQLCLAVGSFAKILTRDRDEGMTKKQAEEIVRAMVPASLWPAMLGTIAAVWGHPDESPERVAAEATTGCYQGVDQKSNGE